MKVVLVNPNDAACYEFKHGPRAHRMPLGLGYVAAALEQRGHPVSIIDAALDNLSVPDTIAKVNQLSPNLVGVGCTTPVFSWASQLSRRLRSEHPELTIALGGAHPSALPESSLRRSGASYVCIDEAEESVCAVVEGRIDAPGIARLNQDRLVTGPAYRTRRGQSGLTAMDLNRVPIPARHLFQWQRYNDPERGVESAETTAMFTRGCPGKCAFCGAAGSLVRYRKIDNIISELQSVSALGIRNVFVMDDSYTSGRSRVLELSRRLANENLGLRLGVQLRLDQVDPEVCDALYASGVRHVGPGIESGNERVIRAIGKGPRESKTHMREKVKLLKQYDWRVRCSYVLGMEGETEAEMRDTIEFARELDADENAFSVLTPYPGSPLWDRAKQFGLVDDYMDFDRFRYYHSVGCNLSAVPTPRLLELLEEAYRIVGNRTYKMETAIK